MKASICRLPMKPQMAGEFEMPINITMPALSPTMEEGNLAKWLVKEGDSVAAGDVIAEIETDKATMEVEAVDEGIIAKIVVAAGTEGVKVNAVIAILAEEGEDASAVSTASVKAPNSDAATTENKASEAKTENSEAQPEAQAEHGAKGAKSAKGEGVTVPAQPVKTEIASDPDIPVGTKVKSMTVRDALNSAMAEEMRRDGDVFVMGEEVAE